MASAFPIFVRAARDDRERLAYGIGRMFHAMVVVGVGLALALALGARFVIEVVAGPDFGPAADVMRIQAVTLFVVFLAVTFNYALLSLRAHRKMLLITGGALAINAVGAAVLGAADGAHGAALATMVADMLGLVATGWALSRLGLPVGRLAARGSAGRAGRAPGARHVVRAGSRRGEGRSRGCRLRRDAADRSRRPGGADGGAPAARQSVT